MSSTPVEPPDGWALERSSDRILLAERGVLGELPALGLDRPEGWERRLSDGASPGGRGGSARVELADGVVARLKPLLRGGAAGRLRHALFVTPVRPLANITVALEAARRGIRTPPPLALCCRRHPRGWQAWLALRDIDGGLDLGRALRRHGAAGVDLDAVTAAIRAAHDAGLEHRDLNVGNLLLVPPDGGDPIVWVLDLDGARLHTVPLPFGLRQRALRRLERSLEKTRAAGTATPTLRERLYGSYAGDDRALAERLARGRRVGRALIGLHALRWRRRD